MKLGLILLGLSWLASTILEAVAEAYSFRRWGRNMYHHRITLLEHLSAFRRHARWFPGQPYYSLRHQPSWLTFLGALVDVSFSASVALLSWSVFSWAFDQGRVLPIALACYYAMGLVTFFASMAYGERGELNFIVDSLFRLLLWPAIAYLLASDFRENRAVGEQRGAAGRNSAPPEDVP
jgi:hypothetical protein